MSATNPKAGEIVANSKHARQDLWRVRERSFERTRYRFAADLLPRNPKGMKLLDVGGGAGEFTEIARGRGFQTTLVDGNRYNVAAEIDRGYFAVEANLAGGMTDVETASYDVVVCLEVIEHIVTAENLLIELSRVLKPDGYIIVSTPNFAFIKDRLSYLLGENAFEEGYHYRFFTKKALAHHIHVANLMIDCTNSIGSAVGVNWLLRKLTLGQVKVDPFRCPVFMESWLARTFMWRLRKLS